MADESPLSIIAAAIADRQADIDPQPGAVFLRGAAGAVVTGRSGDALRWQDDDGEAQTGTVRDFAGRALTRIDIGAEQLPPMPDDAPESLTEADWRYLVHAGQIAKTRGILPSIRMVQLARTIQRAPTATARAVVSAWLAALAIGNEPGDL